MKVFRDFLDIIHQRLYHPWFQCWSKYRLLIRVVEEMNPADIQRLYCLLDPLVVDLELVLAEGETQHIVMDDPRFKMGYNTFIFDDRMPETSVEFPLEIDNSGNTADYCS